MSRYDILRYIGMPWQAIAGISQSMNVNEMLIQRTDDTSKIVLITSQVGVLMFVVDVSFSGSRSKSRAFEVQSTRQNNQWTELDGQGYRIRHEAVVSNRTQVEVGHVWLCINTSWYVRDAKPSNICLFSTALMWMLDKTQRKTL